jgi:hypothetical protein
MHTSALIAMHNEKAKPKGFDNNQCLWLWFKTHSLTTNINVFVMA